MEASLSYQVSSGITLRTKKSCLHCFFQKGAHHTLYLVVSVPLASSINHFPMQPLPHMFLLRTPHFALQHDHIGECGSEVALTFGTGFEKLSDQIRLASRLGCAGSGGALLQPLLPGEYLPTALFECNSYLVSSSSLRRSPSPLQSRDLYAHKLYCTV